MKNRLIALTIVVSVGIGFAIGGRTVSSAQELSDKYIGGRAVFCQVKQSFGTFKSVTVVGGGTAVFEDAKGTIRVITIQNNGKCEVELVIERSPG